MAKFSSDEPYLVETITITNTKTVRKHNPDYDPNALCECGHPYYRHFDTYEDMLPVGCKYCECWTFKPSLAEKSSFKIKDVGSVEGDEEPQTNEPSSDE